jgi:nucleoside-diphosphate-sugar epimerase
MVTINQLAEMAIKSSGKSISVKNIDGEEFKQKYGFKCPVGVRGRNSDNKLYKEKMGVEFSRPLENGIEKTFNWINKQKNKYT